MVILRGGILRKCGGLILIDTVVKLKSARN
jgi:hypothetical protein